MNITQALILMVTAFLLIYDAGSMGWGEPTESMVLRDWAWKANTLPFVWGLLCGHWFAPRQHIAHSGWMYSLPIILAMIIYDVFYNKFDGSKRWFRWGIIWVIIGIPIGSWLWGQHG